MAMAITKSKMEKPRLKRVKVDLITHSFNGVYGVGGVSESRKQGAATKHT